MSLRAARCLRSVVSHATIEQHHVDPSVVRGTMPDLPSGTVTFLFTDIEGSTALWEQDQAAMRLAVDRHLELLDAAIAAHDGHRFQIIGDAVQAAFTAAPDALA